MHYIIYHIINSKMNSRDYSKFLSKNKESPSKSNIVDQIMLKEIEALQAPVLQPQKHHYNLNHNLIINTKPINRYSSAKRIQSKDVPSLTNKTEKSTQKHHSFINPQNEIGGYLNRRHVQELERLKKFKEERDRNEREEFSFKPKISTKSKTIARTLINNDQSVYTNHNGQNNNANSQLKHSRNFIDKSVIVNDRNNHRNQSKIEIANVNDNDISDLVNIRNDSTCFDKENIVKFKLDVEAKEYVLERMKIIRANYYKNK